MKKIKVLLLFIFVIVALLQSKMVNATQNPAMILAPRYFYAGSTLLLPTGIGSNYYNGQAAQHAQNIMLKPDGTILFFIVDNQIYNKWGRKSFDVLFPDDVAVRNSELSIIPDPGNCSGYYIISSSAGSSPATVEPYINYVNMPPEGDVNNISTFFNPFVCNGDDCFINGESLYGGDNYLSNIAESIPLSAVNYTYDKPETSLAVSRLRSDNSRLLFIEHSGEGSVLVVYIYRISATTISYFGKVVLSSDNFSQTNEPEFELKETSDPDIYKIAFTSGYDQLLYYGTINVSTLTATGLSLPILDNGSENSIRGIEFSPNGNFLYVLKNGTVSNFGVINLSTLVYTDNTGSLTNAAAYANSQMELDFNGNLFFTGTNNYVQIGNPNNPASLIYNPAINFTGGFTHPTNFLQDQIDGMDYNAHFLIPACCVQYTSYDKVDFTATSSGTWTSTNPIGTGAIVTIGHELRIPAGINITISGMEIRFSPDAKMVIENGTVNGGRVTLTNGAKLTVDTRCATDKFWKGVEIWGNPSAAQGTFASSQQGWLVMGNNSVIEHAKTGVLCSKRDISENIIASTGGGVIQGGSVSISTARIRNCRTGVDIRDYNQTSASFFERFTFETTSALKETGVTPLAHLVLSSVKGVNILGCIFQNTYNVGSGPSYLGNFRGHGIFSLNADYRVSRSCNGGSCTTWVTPKFTNLYTGIYATNSSSTNTYNCLYGLFTNCVRGIYNNSVDLSNINENTFKIYPMSVSGYLAYGVFLNASTGYSLSNNIFSQNGTGTVQLTKGVIVSNSGIADNLIYRNQFSRLVVGIQVIGINAEPYNTSTLSVETDGLQMKCNTFSGVIQQADIALTSAPETRIAAFQGHCLNLPTSTAGNRFSFNTNNSENDIYTDNGSVLFQYNTNNTASVFPILYDGAKVVVATCGTFDYALSCPVKPVELPGLLANVNNAQSNFENSMEIAETNGALEALEEGLVLEASEEDILMELEATETELALSLNDLQSAYLTDFSIDGLEEVINVVTPQTDTESQRRLAMAYWKKGNTSELATIKSTLQERGETAFVKYLNLLDEVGNNTSSVDLQLLSSNTSLINKITALIEQSEDVKTAGYASALLCLITGTCYEPVVPELEFTGSGARTLQTSESSAFDLAVYPNPVQDILEIQIDNQGKLNCQIFDLSGKLIKAINLNEAERTFSTSFLTSGVYFLEIKTEGNIKQLVRLVKE